MPSTLTAGTLRFVRHCTRFPGALWYLALDAGQRRDHSALAVLYLYWVAHGRCPLTFEYLFELQLIILNAAFGNAGAARVAQFHCAAQLLRTSPNR